MEIEKTCGSCDGYKAGSDGMYCFGGGRTGWTFATNTACKYYKQKANVSNKDFFKYILSCIKDFFYQ